MNREELLELYWNEGLSISEVAKIKKCTEKTSIYSTKTKKDIYILGGRKEIDRFISWLNPCIKNSVSAEMKS